MQQDLLEQKLSRKELQDLKNKRTGLFIFQVSWILVFVCLAIVNWQLRSGTPTWPPEGVEPLNWPLPTVATGLLLVSAWLARRGVQAIRDENPEQMRARWLWALLLGAGFVVLVGYEWVVIPYSAVYSDVFRMMTGFHIVHALVIGAVMLNLRQSARDYGPANFWPVEGAASLWDFVLVAWLLFYVVLYLL